MSNYHNRSGFSISRDPSSVEKAEKQPDWFKDYVANMELNAAKTRPSNIFEEISGILTGKNKFSTVEEVVNDMAKRTGLLEMQQKKSASQSGKFDNIEIFKEIPDMKIYIDNLIEDRPGTSIESLLHDMAKVKSIKDKLQDGDIPLDVKLYINDKLFQKKQENPDTGKQDMNLGKADMEVDDNLTNENNPFQGCEPKTI